MTDTMYATISTTDLIDNWISYGLVSGLVVYLDIPHQVQAIDAPRKGDVIVTTDKDVFTIPRGNKSTKMWKILA